MTAKLFVQAIIKFLLGIGDTVCADVLCRTGDDG